MAEMQLPERRAGGVSPLLSAEPAASASERGCEDRSLAVAAGSESQKTTGGSRPPLAGPSQHALREGHWTGLRLTSEGRRLLAIVAVLLLIGILKNINLLALLGNVLLALLALGALVVGRRLPLLEARRVVGEFYFAGSASHHEIRLRNPTTRRIPGVRIEDTGSAHTAGWFFDQLPGRSRQTLTTELVLPKRGWYDFAPLAATSWYPFGLWQRRVLVGLPLRILVLPQPGKVVRERLRHYLKSADPRGERVHRHGWRHEAAQADFHGLRPFRPGDSPRWIHWRTSARRGELMVREFEDVPGDDLALVLDTHTNPDDFEKAVSLAATIVCEWCHRRGDRLILVTRGTENGYLDGVTGPEHARSLLECLALVTRSWTAVRARDLGLTEVPLTAAILVVAAGPSGLAEELAAELRRPVTLLTPDHLYQQGIYTPP